MQGKNMCPPLADVLRRGTFPGRPVSQVRQGPLDPLQDGFLDEILAPWLPTTSTNNYRIALRKYQHYQRQTCTGLVHHQRRYENGDRHQRQ